MDWLEHWLTSEQVLARFSSELTAGSGDEQNASQSRGLRRLRVHLNARDVSATTEAGSTAVSSTTATGAATTSVARVNREAKKEVRIFGSGVGGSCEVGDGGGGTRD
jgi:hypothetical protein